MAQNQNNIEIDETLRPTVDNVVEAIYTYKRVPVDGGTRDYPVSVKKTDYEPLAPTIKNSKLPFKDFVTVLRAFILANKAGEKATGDAFRFLDPGSGEIDINQLAAVMAIIVPNGTPSMLLDNIQKLGYKRDEKLDLTKFKKLIRDDGVGRDTVLQCLKK